MSAEDALRRALLLYSSVGPDPALTPVQLKSRYENLPVILSDNTVAKFRVHKYRINEADPPQPGSRIRHAAATREWGDAASHLRGWTRGRGSISAEVREAIVQRVRGTAIRTTFNGKGSPSHISLCLTALSVSGRMARALPGSAARSERDRITEYIDTFVGIDCSGYVNNYFIAAGHYANSAENRNVPIRHSYGAPNNRMHFLPDRPQTFMLVWTDFQHIAMIHDWGPGGYEVDMRVIESASSLGGLSDTIYEVRRAPEPGDDPIWQVFSRARSQDHEVYMAAPIGRRG